MEVETGNGSPIVEDPPGHFAESGGDQLDVSLPWGHTRITGSLAVLIILLLLSHIALGYLLLVENRDRSDEHKELTKAIDKLDCRIDLDIYIHTIPEGAVFEILKSPPEIIDCLPDYLTGPQKRVIRPH